MNDRSKARLRRAALVAAVATGAALVHGCGGSGNEGGTRYACAYEKRASQTCNRSDYGAWTRGCSAFDADNYTVTPQQVCQNMTSGGHLLAHGNLADMRGNKRERAARRRGLAARNGLQGRVR